MSNSKDYDDFEVGDTVYCAVYGKGEVKEICDDCEYDVLVFVSPTHTVCYTKDGKISKGTNRTLFFSPPFIVEGDTEKPFKSKLVGKDVIVTITGTNDQGVVFEEDSNYIWLRSKDNHTHRLEKKSISSLKVISETITFQ